MKHKINVTFGGKIVGTAMLSENGEFEADIDESKIPARFRQGFDPSMYLSLTEIPDPDPNPLDFNEPLQLSKELIEKYSD